MPVYTKNNDLIYCVYYDNGKRIWESFGRGPDARRAAETRDLEIKLKKKRGQWNISSQRNSIPFIELAQAYIEHRKIELSLKTREGILRMLTKYVLPVIGTKPIHIINLQDWNKIQDNMTQGGVGPKSINIYFGYLNKLFRWSAVNEYLEEHPWRNRETLRHKKYHIDLFTVKEFQKILDSAPEHLAWAMEVAYFTGMRPGPSELFALTWNNVDFKNNRIKIYATKTDSYRWQYVDSGFMQRMEDRHMKNYQYSETPSYVCTYHGQPVKSLKKAWKKAKEKAGITKRIRLYDIRHFYITYALANGASITELAERVGHVDATMIVKVYAHLAEDLETKRAFEIPELRFPTPTVDKTVDQTKEGVS